MVKTGQDFLGDPMGWPKSHGLDKNASFPQVFLDTRSDRCQPFTLSDHCQALEKPLFNLILSPCKLLKKDRA